MSTEKINVGVCRPVRYHCAKGWASSKVHKDYNPLRQGIAACQDPGWFCLYVVAVRYTVATSPYSSRWGLLCSWASEARVPGRV